MNDATEFELVVPPEMRAFISPACAPDGGPSFVVEGKNSGGVALTNTSLVFELPTDSSFESVTRLLGPVDAVLEVAAGGSWSVVGGAAARIGGRWRALRSYGAADRARCRRSATTA